jgi:hypothetical protein
MSMGFVVLIVLLVAAAGLAGRMWCNRRPPEPLRGDWWSDFERDFRQWVAARERSEQRPSPRRDVR